ncbi:hypothetical protein QA612_01115 [Evansella sp. AB-P1]|uniref:hypothetical protein n=1 Tax=Evansella sp. AB-P1 TaxID=3037653 RepID=UPI00241CB2FC|nr:hypothetical protein [Evansella sp. AB-P1]MDG5786071.1 hypothetical protein [Evansella sp. AB-P1]
MKNRTLYLSLNFLSLLLFFFTLWKGPSEKKRYILPLFLALTGLNYIFEFWVLIIGRAYTYKPKMLKTKYFDNVFGSNVSQLFVVPTTGLFLTIFQLKYRWFLLFAILLTLIEKLFLKNKIFRLHWWKTYFTTIGVPFFYFLGKQFGKLLIEKKNRFIEIFTVFLAIFVSYTTLNFYHVALLKTCLFNIRVFKNLYRSHVAFATLYGALCSIFFIGSIIIKKWYVSILTCFSLIAFEGYLINKKVITISNGVIFYPISFVTKILSIWVGKYVYSSINK